MREKSAANGRHTGAILAVGVVLGAAAVGAIVSARGRSGGTAQVATSKARSSKPGASIPKKGGTGPATTQAAPAGVDPRLWNAQQVQAMPAVQVEGSGRLPTVWAVSDHGHLVRSANLGSTWSLVQSPTGPLGSVTGVSLISRRQGWLLSSKGLYGTTNAGASWVQLGAPNPATVKPGDNVQFAWAQRVGTSAGWALTNLDNLEVTSDGGSQWTVASTPLKQVVAACFTSPTSGLIAGPGPSPSVYETANGGTSWREVWSGNQTAVYEALSCTRGSAVLTLVNSYSQDQARTTEVATSSGWAGRWMVIGGGSPAQTQGAASGGMGRSSAFTTPAGLMALQVEVDGVVRISKLTVAPQSMALAHWSSLGSIGSKAAGPLNEFQYTAGVAFTDAKHGYAVAVSQETGLIELSFTSNGGRSWTSRVRPLL